MIRVRNKKVVSETAWMTYKANKKRNLLTIAAITLTTFLITIILGIGISYRGTITQRSVAMDGLDYDIELTEPRDDQTEAIRLMENVKWAGTAVKCAVVETYQGQELGKVKLYWLDQTCWEKQCAPVLKNLTGHYPRQENEIMLSLGLLESMGIENPVPGMKLELEYTALSENAEEMVRKEFVLSGYFRDYSRGERGFISKTFYASTGVKQTALTQGSLKISLKNPLYSEKDIIKMQNAIDLRDQQIIIADYETIALFLKTAAGLGGMIFMVFLSGYLFIYNTLYISVTKDIRYYGQLRTIGMTTVQMKSMIYKQAVWNSCIGIPAGLIIGYVAAKGVIPRILLIVNPRFNLDEISVLNPVVCLTAAVFALATTLVSSRKPAVLASEISPVEAAVFVPEVSAGKRKRERGGSISMAWRNMFRDKKQAAVILLSFTLTLSVFLTAGAVIRQNDAHSVLNAYYDYDIQIKNETTLEERRPLLTEEKIRQIKSLDGVKEVRTVSSAAAVVPYQEAVYGQYYQDLYKSRYSPGNYEEDISYYKEHSDSEMFQTRFIGIDQAGFHKLNKSLGNVLDSKEFEAGETAVAVISIVDADLYKKEMTGKQVKFFLPGGREPQKEQGVRIAAVGGIAQNPAYFAGGYTPDLIVSQEYARRLSDHIFTELVDVEYEKPFSQDIEREVLKIVENEQISYESKLMRYGEMKQTENQVKVLGGSIEVIMAVLALLNYINMMAAGIQNRTQELAALESIGMTSKQIRKVLMLEGAGYALISIGAALAAGVPLSYTVFQSMNRYGITYSLPVAAVTVLFGVILAACVFVPVCIYQRTQKASIIERLRMVE